MILAKTSRHGFFFSFDALVALLVLLLSFALVLGVKPPTVLKFSEYEGMHSLSEDSMQVFALTPFSSLGGPLKTEIAAAANLTPEEMNKSILDIVGILWGINRTDYAANLTREYFGNILGNSTNYSLVIYEYGNNYIIYNSSSISNKRRVISSTSRVVSGYKENNPRAGFVARAFIASATKRTQSYAYFGGFEGSGNITKLLVLPESVSAISEAYMEMDVASNFTLYINGKYSGSYNISARKPLYAKNWTVPQSYYWYFVNGSNNITVAFSGISSGYVGGGFIRVRYNTTILDTSGARLNPDGNATERYYFPGIDGLINIYSSFYVPGVLKSLGIQLHYLSNYTVYLIIGNVSVYENSTGTPKTIYLNNTFLSSVLNYSFFNQTMPVRFGTRNITGMGEESDVVLITDFSGSMKKAINDDTSQGSASIDCNNLAAYPNARKSELAKCLDKTFVDILLNKTNNRLWPVFIYSNEIDSYDNPQNASAIKNYINSYSQGKDRTCLACALNRGYDILKNNTNASDGRRKVVILMTDGVPTHCASGSCTSNLSAYGTQYCQGYCDFQGGGGSCVYQGCNDNACENPMNNTIYAANRSFTDQSITVHTIGFGLVDACSQSTYLLQKVANMTNGAYYHSSNVTELETIYRNIAKSVISYTTQTAEISGETSPASLYTDSFIEYNYTPAIDLGYGNISLALESDTFGNTSGNYSVESPKNGSYNVSSNMLVTDAKVTSYSSDFWTSSLEVNSTTGSWKTAFSLNTFGTNYMSLGDPFIVNIPVSLIKPGEMNYVRINTAKNSTELEGGSPDNRVIYSVRVKGSVDYGATFNTSDDAKANAKKRLSDYLASFGISADGIDTGSQDIGKIPWMWGPAVMTFEVWK